MGMEMELPLVSCLCPTYGRPELLQEAICCFLQQDYPNKELVVLNDHPNAITLDRDYPGVYVYNCSQRFQSLGQKRNDLVRRARGDFLMNWDDDDLYLPWRISEMMKHLYPAADKWFCKPTQAWRSTNNGNYRLNQSHFHGQAAMRRILFDELGGYAEMNVGEDLDLEARVPRERRIVYRAQPSELCYVYREGNGIAHISEFRMDQPGRPTSWERMADRYRDRAGGLLIPGFGRNHWQDVLEAARTAPGVDPVQLFLLTRRLEPYLGTASSPTL